LEEEEVSTKSFVVDCAGTARRIVEVGVVNAAMIVGLTDMTMAKKQEILMLEMKLQCKVLDFENLMPTPDRGDVLAFSVHKISIDRSKPFNSF
jgi:hypothetical protein